MRKALRSAALAALLATAGCNLAPPHVRPPLPTEPAYPAQYSGEINEGRRAVDMGWREFFVDPALAQLIGVALERNRDLAVAVGRIDEARGQYRIQDSSRYPQLGASGGATRSRTPLGTIAGAGGASGSITIDNIQVGVGVTSFELDFWGRVRNLSEAARRQYLSTVQAERAFRLTLIRDVATAYFTSREADERIDIAETAVASREEGVEIARLRMEGGVTSALDFHQAETLLTQAQTQLATARQNKAQADNFLTQLVGGAVPEGLPSPLPIDRQSSRVPIAPGLPSDLLNDRPDILQAEEQLRAARANIGAARAAFFPTISLTGNAGFSSPQLDGLFSGDTATWSFGPRISIPIFDWGNLRGNLTVAQARENIAVATYERTVQGAFREVADALAGRRWLAEQVDSQERALEAQRNIARLARLRYQEGVDNYLVVLDAERSLFDAEQGLIQLRRTELENLVSLYIALGGGLVESTTARP